MPSESPVLERKPDAWWVRLLLWPIRLTGDEPPDISRRRRIACAIACWEVLAFQAALMLTTGDIMTALALHLNFSKQWIGLLGVLPAAATLLHPVGSWAVERLGRKKPFHLWLVGWSRVAFFAPVLTYPLWPEAWQRPGVFVGLVIANALFAIATNAWQAWMGDLSDGILRGRFFGMRYALSAVAALIISPLLLRTLGQDPTDADFFRLFVWGLAASVISLVMMLMQDELPPPRPAVLVSLREAMRALLETRNVRQMLAFRMVHDFGVHLAAPFWLVYHREVAGLSFATIAWFSITAQICAIIGFLFWGRLADRIGHKPVVIIGVLGAGITPLFWYWYTPATWWIMFPEAALSGLFWSGVVAQSYTLLVASAPAGVRTHLLALVSAGSGLTALIGGALGGALAEASHGWRWEFGPEAVGFALIGLHLNFTLSLGFRLGSLLLLRGFYEPGARASLAILGLMVTSRGWRQLLAMPIIESAEGSPPRSASPAQAAGE